MTHFSVLLDRRLQALKLTQTDLAKRLGCRQTYISKLLNSDSDEKAAPPFKEAAKWARALEVSEQAVIDSIWATKHPGIMPPSAAVNAGGYFIPLPEEDRNRLESIARDPVRIIQALVRQAIRER